MDVLIGQPAEILSHGHTQQSHSHSLSYGTPAIDYNTGGTRYGHPTNTQNWWFCTVQKATDSKAPTINNTGGSENRPSSITVNYWLRLQ